MHRKLPANDRAADADGWSAAATIERRSNRTGTVLLFVTVQFRSVVIPVLDVTAGPVFAENVQFVNVASPGGFAPESR
jgi:hypothetical protein